MQKLRPLHFILFVCLSTCSSFSVADRASDIANDETVQFFATAARFNEESQHWHVPIHGWIYEPTNTWFRKLIFSKALEQQFALRVEETTEENFNERVSLLIADNERNKRIVVRVGDKEYDMPPSAPNGHFIGHLEIDASSAEALARDNMLDYYTVARDGREFAGSSQLILGEGLSVISDIDDTVKITQVLDRRELVNSTFLQDFVAVPGMAQSYQLLAEAGASFHFVSSSPWQLYPALQHLLQEAGFPWATMHLKSMRFRDRTLLNLFKPGTETKPPQIRDLVTSFPLRDFILIGDSGEADPEVYAEILREFPERVEHVFIRNITNERLDNARFKPLVDEASKWTLFIDPSSIHLPVVRGEDRAQ